MPTSVSASSTRSNEYGEKIRYVRPNRKPPSVKPAPQRRTGSRSKGNVADKISTGPAPTVALIQKHHDQFEEHDPDFSAPISEHKEKYVEWDVHNRPAPVVPQRRLTPVVPYHLGMDVAQWQSETNKQYHKHDVAAAARERAAAGAAARGNNKKPTAFAWQQEERAVLDNFSDDEPTSAKGGVVHKGHIQHNNVSEHSHQYNWPQMEKPVQSAAPRGSTNPVVTDTYQYNDRDWQTEYDDRCAELRAKQQAAMGTVAATAGVARPPAEKSPAYYAWKKQARAGGAGAVEGVDREVYDLGHSEYGAQYVEWPLQQSGENNSAAAATAERVAAQPKLNLFLSNVDGVQDAYAQDRGRSVYAVDYQGGAAQNTSVPGSEEEFMPPAPPPLPVAGLVSAPSEKKLGHRSKKAAPPAPPLPLFADANTQPPQSGNPEFRTLRGASSEYIAKYNWPVGASRVQSTADSEEFSNIDHAAVIPHNASARGWASEYDEQCEMLRQRQRALLSTADAGRVAGKPSAARLQSEFYFAIPEMPAPPSPPRAPSSPMDRGRKSEYIDKYVPLPMDQRPESLKEKVEVDMHKDGLNLFDGRSNAAAGSEYAANYTAKDAASTASLAPAGPAPKTDPKAPAQFAWSLNDPSAAERVYEPSPTELLNAKRRHNPATPDTTGRIPTETGERYKWPMSGAGEGHVAGKHSSLTEGDGNALQLTDGSVGSDEKWPYDNESKSAAQNSPNSVAAGIIAVDKREIPNFYAWADEQQQKPPAPVRASWPADGVKLSPRHTEYGDEYQAWAQPSGAKQQEAENAKKVRAATAEDHLTAVFAPLGDDAVVCKSEYADKYTSSKQSDDNKRTTQPVAAPTNPPHFAWTLVDGAPPSESPKKKKGERRHRKPEDIKRSETGDKFQWPVAPLADEIAKLANEAKLTALRQHNTRLFGGDEVAADADHWKSVYASQSHKPACSDEPDSSSSAVWGAGSTPAAEDPAPAFFAWNKDGAAQSEPSTTIVAERVNAVRNVGIGESTEYHDNYVPQDGNGQSRNAELAKARRDAFLAGTLDRFDSVAGGQDRKFRGSSEYDDNYVAASASAESKSFAKKYDYSHSLRQTNLEQAVHYKVAKSPASDLAALGETQISLDSLNKDVEIEPSQIPSRPKSAPATGRRGAGCETFLTEYTAKYTIPQPFKAQASASTATSHNSRLLNSSVVLGNNVSRSHVANALVKSLTSSASSSAASSTIQSTSSASSYSDDEASESSSKRWSARRQALSTHKHSQMPSTQVLRDTVAIRNRKEAALRRTGSPVRRAPPVVTASSPALADQYQGIPTATTTASGDNSCANSDSLVPAVPASRTADTISDHSSIGSSSSGSIVASSKGGGAGVYFNGSAIATAGTRTPRFTDIASSADAGSVNERNTAQASARDDASSRVSGGSSSAAGAAAAAGRASSPFAKKQYHVSAGTMNSLRSSDAAARARSAPPRQMRSVNVNSSSPKKKQLYVDESHSNPVLMNRRYPFRSDKHSGRWSTETGDSFRWRKAAPGVVA